MTFVVLPFACALFVVPRQSTITLEPWQDDRYEEAALSSEQDLNCDVLAFQREALPVIIPIEADATAQRTAQLRRLGKTTVECVLAAPVPVTALIANGSAAALELDWFDPDTAAPPPSSHLGVVTELWGDDVRGAPILRSVVYAFDAAQYQTRLDELAASLGAPLAVIPLWTGASITDLGSGPYWFLVNAPSTSFHGLVAVRGSLLVTGQGCSFFDGIDSVGEAWIAPGTFVESHRRVPSIRSPGVLVDEASARAAAMAAGTYFPDELELTSAMPDGLYFAEGMVDVTARDVARHWTIVSAGGTVCFSGTGNTIEPFTDLTVAFAVSGNVLVHGRDNVLAGEVHAPNGGLWVLGAASQLIGQASGRAVSVTAPRVLVSDGTHPRAP